MEVIMKKRKPLSEEHKRHIREALVGKKQTPDHIEKRMANRRGKKLPPAWRQHLSESHSGVPLSASHARNISKALSGRTLTPEHAQKLREAALERYRNGWAPCKGLKKSAAEIEAMRKRMTGRKLSEATRKKLSAINTGKKMPEEARLKMIAQKRRDAKFGPANANWKGGSWPTYHTRARVTWERYRQAPIPPGYLIHHADQNPKNNSIDNLMLLTYKEHRAIHKTLPKIKLLS